MDDTVRYSMVSRFDRRIRPKSVQLSLEPTERQRFRAISHEPPALLWRRPSMEVPIDRQEILKRVSYKMIRKKIAWKRIRYAAVRIDCWNRTYRRPPLKRPRLKLPKVFYHPKPHDTWNEESIPTPTPRSIPSRRQRVEGKPRVDTWLRKPYVGPESKFKIFNKPIQIEGRSRVDTWSKFPYQARSTSARVRNTLLKSFSQENLTIYFEIDYPSTDTSDRKKQSRQLVKTTDTKSS